MAFGFGCCLLYASLAVIPCLLLFRCCGGKAPALVLFLEVCGSLALSELIADALSHGGRCCFVLKGFVLGAGGFEEAVPFVGIFRGFVNCVLDGGWTLA